MGHGAARVAWLDHAVDQEFAPAATETAPPTRLAATDAAPATPTVRALLTGMAAVCPVEGRA